MIKTVLFSILALIFSGCGKPAAEKPSAEGQHTIVTTVGMVGDLVRQVAGEHAQVEFLVGEGVDPHLYKPTRSDVAALMGADAIFYAGLYLEGRMIDALKKVQEGGKPVFAVTDPVPEAFLLHPEDSQGHADPHIWMDVEGWVYAVDAVVAGLVEFDAAHAADYQANAQQLKEELKSLQLYVKEVLSSVPESQRVMVTAHDAFNYFGRAYGLEVLGIQGISTESEAGIQDINRLVDLLVERKIPAVFVESTVASKNVMALIEGAASKGHEVIIGGELFSDAMGEPGTYEGSYIGMIDHNATTVARALGGEASPGGMQGKLDHD